jgi:hypothetical protein
MLIGGLALLAAVFSFAQVTGEIRGVVLDANSGDKRRGNAISTRPR